MASGLARIPASQLAAQKLVVNQAYEAMGIGSTQTLGPILDGLMRNTPDALAWIERAEADDAVRRAYMFSDDLAAVATAALTTGTAALSAFRLEVMRPVQPMLASPAAGASAP